MDDKVKRKEACRRSDTVVEKLTHSIPRTLVVNSKKKLSSLDVIKIKEMERSKMPVDNLPSMSSSGFANRVNGWDTVREIQIGEIFRNI